MKAVVQGLEAQAWWFCLIEDVCRLALYTSIGLVFEKC